MQMSRTTFRFLLQLLSSLLERRSSCYGRFPISPEKQLFLAIWMMATPNSYRCVSDRFDISKSTAWSCVRKVVNALYKYRNTFIKWPSTEEAIVTMDKIEQKHRFPKTIGAIDGTHIKIASPKEHHEAYINRKGVHSIQLQVVCDHSLKFTHCYCGEVGSVHDMRVFRLSGFDTLLVPEKFPNDSHILGDAAYSLHRYLLVPFKDNSHLTEAQKKYNYYHSASRVMVERSLALLKGRFRSLLDKLPMTRTELIPKFVVSCCILHNICILQSDFIEIPIIVDTNEENISPSEHLSNRNKEEAILKRNAIVYTLMYENV
ncbi:putative nuclease HARBI1 [Prorops nasuta]|uniref:putative nuclease HARBI1 n=1 Tax=Prorops nasuta TaxID=863751 RepID=UPI0034CDE904